MTPTSTKGTNMKKTPLNEYASAEQIASEVRAQRLTFVPFDRTEGSTIVAQAAGRPVMVTLDEGTLEVCAADLDGSGDYFTVIGYLS